MTVEPDIGQPMFWMHTGCFEKSSKHLYTEDSWVYGNDKWSFVNRNELGMKTA